MSITSGTKLGPYEILSAIGEGGHGRSLQSQRHTCERKVAIKVLPSHFSDNAEMKVHSTARRKQSPDSIIRTSPLVLLFRVGSRSKFELRAEFEETASHDFVGG